MKIIGIIPARYGATRFPGKPVADIFGKSMIQWVYEGAGRSKILDKIIIATDDKRVFECASKFTKDVMLTPEFNSGTDRLAFAAKNIDCDIVVNIQGDEPLIEAAIIDSAVEPLVKDGKIDSGTIAAEFENESEKNNPNNVKVITDKNNFAIYFSRLPLPASLKHIGLYVYKKDFLMKFSKMEQTELELKEKLEQLRIIENGYKIYVTKTGYKTIGVDTKEDLEKVKKLLAAR
jgi:3-deoxy-manno-octulosonate cytidylyltransferase (CMP-KDO synthetase)